MTAEPGSPSDGRASIIGRLASAPWHPVLFAAVIVLSAWFDAAISPYPLVRPLLIAVLGAAVLTVVAGLAFRSAQVGGLVATAIIWVLWSRHLLDLAETAIHRLGVAGIAWAAAVVLVLILVARMVLRRSPTGGRSRARRPSSTEERCCWSFVTVVMGAVTGKVGQAIADLSQGEDLEAWLASPGTDAGREGPDVYAILLDGYPRADVLADAFDIDNEPFVGALEERGFAVAGASHSDYIWTHTTVPSTLHMDYVEHIPALEPVAAGEAPQQPTIRNAIDDNPVWAVARDHGYTTVSVGSGFEQVTARKTDVFVDSGDMNEFEVSLLASTFLGDIVNLVAPTFAASEQAARIEHNLDTLPTIAGGGRRARVRVGPRSGAAPADRVRRGRIGRRGAAHRHVLRGLADGARGGSGGVSRAVSGAAGIPQRSDPRDGRRHRQPVGRATGHPPVRGSRLGIPRRLDRRGAHGGGPRAASWSGRAPCSRR